MRLSRDQFINHFAVSIGVHTLKLWSRRSKEPPDHVARSAYEVIRTSRGDLSLSAQQFSEVVQPVIAELHKRTQKGERPSALALTGMIYDALDKAGSEVTLRPAALPHGGGYGRK